MGFNTRIATNLDALGTSSLKEPLHAPYSVFFVFSHVAPGSAWKAMTKALCIRSWVDPCNVHRGLGDK